MFTMRNILRKHLIEIVAISIVLFMIIVSLAVPQHSQAAFDPSAINPNPNNSCGNNSDPNCVVCSRNPDTPTPTPTTEGNTCYSAYNACGVRNTGTIRGGVCSVKVQTGVSRRGKAIYSYYPVTVPANPLNYGVACKSTANTCGTRSNGTIGCNGLCSVTAAPALPVGYGTACTSTNACGVRASGTKNCSLTCSAAAPALPAGYGTTCTSPANACGTKTSGTIACTGSCSATTAPALPAGYGTACRSAANTCGMKATGVIQCSGSCSASTPSNNLCAPDATVTLKANPGLVQKDSSATVVWTSTNAASCTVIGTNGDSWSGTSGTRTSGAIPDKTTFTLTCTGINTQTITKSVVVDIVPKFREF